MPNFEKYNLSQVKTERFYQLPKYLFEDVYFKNVGGSQNYVCVIKRSL